MIKVIEQADLKSMNTLFLPCTAYRLLLVDSISELKTVYSDFNLNAQNSLLTGSGSNLVLPAQLDRTVIKLRSRKIQYHAGLNGHIVVDADAGVIWDDLVKDTVNKGYRGLENLSLIPGSVGAAPVQNIGAYSVELADVLEAVQVLNIKTMQVSTLNRQDCRFSYRDSIFKQNQGQLIILNVSLRLSKERAFSLEYGELKKLNAISDLSVSDVRKKVIHIRKIKLPDPVMLPNAGSFFKNPVVSEAVADKLSAQFSGLIRYSLSNKRVKLAAGWLIEQSGLKGFRKGNVGVHERQALVLVNHGGGSQKELLALVEIVQRAVFKKFKVTLEIEPQIIFE